MAENQFLTYQKFTNQSEAKELSDLLTKGNIEFIVEDTSVSFDPSFANNESNNEYRIRLKKQDFEQADKILMDIPAKQFDAISEDYYLFEFQDQELLEVLIKRDEWSKFDYLLAQKILKDRGQKVSKELLQTFRKQRIEELAKPEGSQKVWISAGYVLSILGGLLGFFIGWHLLYHKKTLPNGDQVYGYSVEDRKQGKRILIVSVIFLIIWTTIRLMGDQ